MGSLAPPKSYLACQISYSCAMLVLWLHTSKNLTLFLSESVLILFAKKTPNPTKTNKPPKQTKQKTTLLIHPLLCWSANSDYKTKATVFRNNF